MAYQRFSLFPDSPSFKDLFSARSLRYRWRNGDPVITTAIMAICIVVWAIEAVLFLVWPEGGNAFVNAGMLLPATAVRHPWTFITSMFLHQPTSLWHILFNMLTLWCVGPVLERMMGHWPYLALYLLSGLGGGAGLMVWAVCSPSGWMTAAYGASGALFGLLAALAQLSKFTPLRLLAKIYVDFIRGTPLLVQIFIIYFALPAIIGQRIDPFVAAVAACSINSGAYVAEIFRAGIQSIEIGQMRAGLSLGMTWGQTMRYIILPQAFKRIIPPLGNEFIAMLKDSSLVSVIGFEELTRTGQLIIAETYGSLEIWTSVAIIYLVMTLTITRLVSRLEKKFKASDAR